MTQRVSVRSGYSRCQDEFNFLFHCNLWTSTPPPPSRPSIHFLSLSKSPGLRQHICSGSGSSAGPRPLLSTRVSLITSGSSQGVKKVYCNHLGRNGPAFPILTQTRRGGGGGEARNKVTLMEHWWQNKARAGTAFCRFSFLMPPPRVSTCLRKAESSCSQAGGSGARIKMSPRGNGHVIYCCRRGATGASARGGRYKMTDHRPRSSPGSGISPIVTGPRGRSVTLYFENTLWWQLNINMGNYSLRAVSTLHGACKSLQSVSQLK